LARANKSVFLHILDRFTSASAHYLMDFVAVQLLNDCAASGVNDVVSANILTSVFWGIELILEDYLRRIENLVGKITVPQQGAVPRLQR